MHSNLELFGISLITGASFLLVPSVAAAQSAPVAQSEAVTKYAAASPKQKPGRVKKDNPTQQLKKDNPTQQPESVKKDNPT
ncbi:MAG TPA: hypothetical protein VFU80_03650 [Sphingomicrobium sp.]|nr:hypothetical protein [Sphingomicrobium sp.]